METYVVRIYRRSADQEISGGYVEVVETQEKKPFKSTEELHCILDSLGRPDAKIIWEAK